MILTGLNAAASLLLVLLLGCTRHSVHGGCDLRMCTDSSRCVISAERRSCKCVTGLYGDRCERDAQIRVLCGKDYIAMRAVEDYFKYNNVPLESLHLPNKSCHPQRVVISGVPHYVSKIYKDQYLTCGGKPLEKNFTHITYSLSLMSEPQVTGNIIRDPVIRVDFKCIYPYVRTVSMPFPVVPFSSETWMRMDELDATIQMVLYTDQSYTEAYSQAPTIELRDKVYVEVAVTEPVGFFLLRVNECWATQLPQPGSMEDSSHSLLQNGCPSDPTLSFLNGSLGRNGEGSTLRFSFDMFRFTGEPHDLYLHCTVQLCEPDKQESCTPSCNSISKREAVRGGPTQGLLSYGPIRIEIPERSQTSILMAVVLPVVAVWTVGFFLLILITVAKASSRKLEQTDCQPLE